MEINYVNFLNLDTLYDIVIDKFYDHNYKNIKFGMNLQQLLNHIVITLDLSEVSQYEYIFLKMFCSSITELEKKEYNLEYVDKNYKDINENISRLLSLLRSIEDQYKDDNKIPNFNSYLSPSAIITGRCVATLSGSYLANIITLEPRDFFIKATNNKCVIVNNEDTSKNKLDPDYGKKIYEDEDIKNYIIAEFIQSFYKFMVDKATYVDLASDSFNHQRFLSLAKKDNISVLNIRNPYFTCDFINDDTTVIMENLSNYKDASLQKDYTIDNTYFEINICSNFGVFFELMSLLPYNKFITLESFDIPSNKSLNENNIPDCPEEIVSQFENRYRGRIKGLITEIRDKYKEDKVKKLELTQNYVDYSYIILLSLSDIDIYLNKYINKNKDSNDYVIKKTIDIIKQIIIFTMSIYKKM